MDEKVVQRIISHIKFGNKESIKEDRKKYPVEFMIAEKRLADKQERR